MSFSTDGVKFTHRPRKANLIFGLFVKITEAVLSVLFVISLAAPLGFPNQADAVAGVSTKLSYQGRLTDASGNPLTGTYCIRFSLWDVGTGGTRNPDQLWPAAYAVPTSNSVSVLNGVFNASVGVADDLSAYDFSANNTEYLYVEVNNTASTCSGSWEALSPYQRVDATAYARYAENLYGGNVRIGTGAGTGSPKLLYLDVKNTTDYIGDTCSTNGTVWFNSASSRGLICESGHLKALSNATTTLDAVVPAGNLSVAATAITNGTVTLAGGNNITLSQAGNALTIIGGGGGGGAALSAGTQSVSTGTVNFANSNNISFGMSGSNQITASYSQSVQTQNIVNAVILNTNGNTAGVTASVSSGTLNLAGGNNITLSQNGNAITVSGPYVHNVSIGGNSTSAGAGYIQVSSGTLLLAGGNNITLSQNGASVTISAFNQSVQTQNLYNLTLAGNSTSAGAGYIQVSSGTLTLAGGNNITLSQNGNAITISAGAGGGLGGIAANAASTVGAGTVVFSNSNGVSFGLNGSTMTASVAAGGGGGATFNQFQWPPGQSSLLGAQSNAFMSFIPFQLQQNLTATRAMVLGSFNLTSNSTGALSFSLGIYTRNGSTLSLASSGSQNHTFTSGQTASYAGLRRFSVPININATPGEYWYGVWVRSTNAGTLSVIGGAATSAAFSGNFGIATNSSRQPQLGQGVFSNASFTTAIPSSVAISNIKAGGTAGWANQPSIIFTNFDLN